MSGDTANVWQDMEPRMDPDSFCTLCQISSIKKGYIQEYIETKRTFQMGLWILFQKQHQKGLTSETTLSNHLLIVGAY